MLLGANAANIKPEETILILPAISVGNVGQLAVDLLITNLNLKYFGRVNGHDCTLPIVGSDPFGDDHLCTSLTAYHSDDLHVLLFQQRSDFLREKKKEYLTRLLSWLKESRFRAVFILTSVFAYERTDAEMAMNPLQFRSTSAGDKYLKESKIRLEDCGASKVQWPATTGVEDGADRRRLLPGSGIAQALYENCEKADLPLILVSKYCMEGDNTMDSCQVASACASLLGLPDLPKKWRIPNSWRTQ